MQMSRIMPPATPVIVPMIIATQNGNSAMRLFSIPTTVNRASPIVSKMKNVLFILMRYLRKSITNSRAVSVQMRYMESVIQNGLVSSSRSLIVPPPTAVTNPTTKAPNRSKSFCAASLIPLMANANVPKASNMKLMLMFDIILYVVLFLEMSSSMRCMARSSSRIAFSFSTAASALLSPLFDAFSPCLLSRKYFFAPSMVRPLPCSRCCRCFMFVMTSGVYLRRLELCLTGQSSANSANSFSQYLSVDCSTPRSSATSLMP